MNAHNNSTRKRNSSSRGRPQPHQQQLPPLSIVTTTGRTAPARPTKAAPQQQQQQVRNNNRQQPSSSSSLLVTLSESCRTHATTAHAGSTRPCAASLDKAPEYCQEALAALTRILPKVEQAYNGGNGDATTAAAAGGAGGGGGNVSVHDVSHMCDFYNDVIAGGFCPHAPHLFLSVQDIMPRVHFLFHHLTSQAVIHNTAQQQQQEAVSVHICRTVARLLCALPDSKLLSCVVRDLIYLAKDLAVLLESGLLLKQDAVPTVEVVLLEETIENSDWSSREFTLPIRNVEALLSLQSATFVILERFVTIRKERRLVLPRQQQQQQVDATAVVLEELDESYLTVADPDLYFSAVLNVDDECTRTLLIALRHSLLAASAVRPQPTTSPVGAAAASRLARLAMVLKQASINVLLLLQADWHRAGVQSLATVQEAALLVARATLTQLEATTTTAFVPSTTTTTTPTNLTSGLVKLVAALIIQPPFVQGSISCRSTVASLVHGSVFDVMCQCVPHVEKTCGAASSGSQLLRPLEIIVLKACHVIVLDFWTERSDHESKKASGEQQRSSPLGLQMILSNNVVGHLFRLLSVRELCDSAVWILSYLLCPPNSPDSLPAEIDGIAEKCIQEEIARQSQASTAGDEQQRQHDDCAVESSATSGSKRKQLPRGAATSGDGTSHSVSPVSADHQQKRRRMDPNCFALSFDDELSAFLSVALRSSSGLRSIIDNKETAGLKVIATDSTLVNVVNVSSAIRLLFASAMHHGTETDFMSDTFSPHLFALSGDFLETLTGITVAVRTLNDKEDRNFQLLVAVIAACGIHVEVVLNTLKIISQQSSLFAKAQSFNVASRFARDWYRGSSLHSNSFPSIPDDVRDTVYACVIQAGSVRTNPQTQLDIFSDNSWFSVTVDLLNAGSISSSLIELLAPFTPDVNLQLGRLKLLTRRTTSKEWDQPEDLPSVERLTLGVMKLVGEAQPDPVVRLLLWQSLAWLFVKLSPNDLRRSLCSETSEANSSDTVCVAGTALVHYLIDGAFADQDQTIRDYASRELGKVLSANNWTSILAALSNDEEWLQHRAVGTSIGNAASAQIATEQVTSRLFRYIDNTLHKLCSVPQSQLSFTVASATRHAGTSTPKLDDSTNSVVIFRRSAARSLCSLCIDAEPRSHCGTILFDLSLIRVVRMWAGIDAGQRFESAGVCFAELSNLSHRSSVGPLLRERVFTTFAPALFRDVLVPSSSLQVGAAHDGLETMTHGLREHQFDLLSTFLSTILRETWSGKNESELVSNGDSDIERSLAACLPFVISQLIVEKDYDALRLTAAYKLYLLGQKRLDYKLRKRSGTSYLKSDPANGIVIGENSSQHSKAALARQWSRNLEDQTRQLCLAPGLIEQIIPHVFMRAGRSELIFFTKNVLQNKVTLKQLVSSREMLTLKNFVLELGRNAAMTDAVIRALKTAAIARISDASSRRSLSARSNDVPSNEESAVTSWVSLHFMYLLVNVVQYKWTTKSVLHRVQALRSLVSTLDFLRPTEASQYLPQIMATVNAALSDEPASVEEPDLKFQLRLLAVRVLSKFAKLVAQTQWEVLGQNLTAIVVSLVPILTDEENAEAGNINVASKECQQTAVSLLEWLTGKEGDLGTKLAPFFSEIPFLPPSSSLDSVRNSLRSQGVNFDSLQVVTTQTTQQDHSTASDGASTGCDSRAAASNGAKQAALRRRLETVCSLLENENASVRRVVLQHLTALLRANRELFHALVDNEGATSMKHYATVAYRGKRAFSRGTVAEILDVLLARCVHESDPEARVLLATCFGEVGAIGAHRLEDVKIANNSSGHSRRSLDPPWHSTSHAYELQLITTHLVVALKSAPTSSDQHKIAFTIQQLLALLNKAGKDGLLGSPATGPEPSNGRKRSASLPDNRLGNSTSNNRAIDTSKPQMEESLVRKLVDSRVLDVVEPFWFSEFHEAENNLPRQPPFFKTSSTFYGWLSNWCRYMVHRAHDKKKNEWTGLFFACRTALRTQAGLSVAEFLLPVLILDRLCFGNGHDQNTLVAEIRDVLTFDDISENDHNQSMPQSDRRKAVSAVFSAIELLQHWVEPETEQRYTKKTASTAKTTKRQPQAAPANGNDWQQYESAMRIEDMIGQIPLDLRAKAAASVGMHACALRFLEMASRSKVAATVFGKNEPVFVHKNQNRSRAAGDSEKLDVSLMKKVLASLDDYETMSSLGDDDVWSNPGTRAQDSIRQKEALRDWQGALHDYERAQQLNPHDPTLRLGVLRCLLELGHFESVLQQVKSMAPQESNQSSDSAHFLPLAVEASYRLGRWDTLSQLVESENDITVEPDGLYQIHLGKAMLSVHQQKFAGVASSLKDARCAVMEGISSVARESYTRAYEHIVRLQALREIEDASELLCSNQRTSLGELSEDAGLGWHRRLEMVSSSGATTVINTRLALARLAGDSAFEGSLFLRMGKRERKSGLPSIAANSFAQAEAAFSCIDPEKRAILKSSLQLQFAKLKHHCGESSLALRMLGQEDIETMGALGDNELVAKAFRRVVGILGIEKHGMNEKEIMDVFVRSALQSTRWMIEGGLKGGSEIMARFRIIHRVANKFEKGHFQFAKYVDSLLQSRIMALQGRSTDYFAGAKDDAQRSHTIARDKTCQKYIGLAVEHYGNSVSLDVKHVYQALPRLLSLWFDFTAIKYECTGSRTRESARRNSAQIGEDEKLASSLKKKQEETNAFMAKTFRIIPAHVFYTAMPQLISRIIHPDVDTAKVAQAILRRILTKFPAQAMWPLAWIRQSNDTERQRIGIDIFSQAIKSLSTGQSGHLHKLLVASKTLIDYLYALAKKEVSDTNSETMKVRPLSAEVELSEFVPPIQAALSVSLAAGDSGKARDIFPRHMPRLRAFDDIVGLMNSKAKPKRLRAYIVSVDTIARSRSSPTASKKGSKDNDIGEIHFLVKQEAKGDLRKDARVQDLNKIVNRIMSSTNDAKGLSGQQRRRLHLRTFTVTCLSEDTGLLEWVPHTAALRSMIHRTYNPQANVMDGKRRGKRITNFLDPQLRLKFEKKCQEAYFVSGNLTKAGVLFEKECLVSYPPILYWWFVHQFPDPHAWYEARTRFTLSAAAWSAVGHIIGLGDRHAENILLDRTTGECVHVDFDCIFDKGLHLPKPEIVPFRLTHNMIDAMGPTGTDGVYSCNLKAAMSALRQNRDTLLSVLEPFVNDPVINWKKYRSQQRGTVKAADKDPTVEAKQKMSVIDERLRGIYNLRNPNHKKIQRTDGFENQQDDDLIHPIPLSVEGQVHKLIAEATSNENLVQLYVGWMPWI